MVSILGLPHVLAMARERKDVDEKGRVYINLSGIKRYLPQSIVLYQENYKLPLQTKLQKAFDTNHFEHSQRISYTYCDTNSTIPQQGAANFVENPSLINWLSSPAAIKLSLEQNMLTRGKEDQEDPIQHSFLVPSSKNKSLEIKLPDNAHSFKGKMLLSLSERRSALGKIYKKLCQQTAINDEKVIKLKKIIETHCISSNYKTIVFVDRFVTALYLEKELDRAFGDNLSVACTVEEGSKEPKLKSPEKRKQILKDFSPKSHKCTSNKRYDLLICTDAEGIAVNLQDADILINYDHPLGADVLFQRVGRILRMTDDPERIVHIHTFVPSITKKSLNGSNIHHKIIKSFERLRQREEKSGSVSVLGTKILSLNKREANPISSDLEIEELFRESEAVNGLNLRNSPLRHMSILETNEILERASLIPDYSFSAKITDKPTPFLFILFKYENKYYPTLYDIKTEIVTEPDVFEILDLLECEENEDKAPIYAGTNDEILNPSQKESDKEKFKDTGIIEAESLKAAELWSSVRGFPKDEITKICGLYFVPSAQNKPRNIFGNLRNK